MRSRYTVTAILKTCRLCVGKMISISGVPRQTPHQLMSEHRCRRGILGSFNNILQIFIVPKAIC